MRNLQMRCVLNFEYESVGIIYMQLINRKNKERLKNGSIPVFLSVFGLLVIVFQPELNSGIPSYSSLKKASGVVSSVYISQGKSSHIEFKLSGTPNSFYYNSNAGDFGLVGDALDKAQLSIRPIELLYEDDGFRPLWANEDLYSVWQFNEDGKSIRSYLDISAAHQSENRFGQIICNIIGGLLFLLSVVTGVAFLKKEFGRNHY